MRVSAREYTCPRRPEASGPPELEFQMVATHVNGVLGTEF